MQVGGRILQVCGPGKGHQQPHEQGSYKRVADMVKETDGKESENKRKRFVPVPIVLVQEIQNRHAQSQQPPSHAELILGFLTRFFGSWCPGGESENPCSPPRHEDTKKPNLLRR